MTSTPADQARLEPRPVHYAVALGVYVALGLVFKTAVLNWIVGPLFMVATIELLPRALGRARRTPS